MLEQKKKKKKKKKANAAYLCLSTQLKIGIRRDGKSPDRNANACL